MTLSFSTTIVIFLIVFIFIFIATKKNGIKGSWDSRQDIQTFAYLMNDTKLIKEEPKKINNSADFESIGEKISRNYLEKVFKKKFLKKRPDFLKNPITNCNLELDCFCDELNLALEYNGRQHYEFTPKFHKSSIDFQNQKYRDMIKKKLCYENGVNLIEVPYTIPYKKIPEYIKNALGKLGYKIDKS